MERRGASKVRRGTSSSHFHYPAPRSFSHGWTWNILICGWGAAIYRSPEALWARNPQKVSKKCSRASRPGVSKKCRKVPNDPKKSQKDYKSSVWGLFRHFFDIPGGEAREHLFDTFWGFRGSGVWRLLYMGIAIANRDGVIFPKGSKRCFPKSVFQIPHLGLRQS